MDALCEHSKSVCSRVLDQNLLLIFYAYKSEGSWKDAMSTAGLFFVIDGKLLFKHIITLYSIYHKWGCTHDSKKPWTPDLVKKDKQMATIKKFLHYNLQHSGTPYFYCVQKIDVCQQILNFVLWAHLPCNYYSQKVLCVEKKAKKKWGHHCSNR